MGGTKIRISREKKASSLAFFPRRSIQGAAEERLSREQSKFYSRLPRRSIIYRRNTAAPWRRAGRSLRPRRLAKFEYRGIRIVINHRCAERTTVSALRKVRKQKRAATSVKNGAGLLANPRQAPVLARRCEFPAAFRLADTFGATFWCQKVVNPLLAGDAQSKVRDTSRRIDRKKILLDSFFRAFGLIQKHQKIKHGEK